MCVVVTQPVVKFRRRGKNHIKFALLADPIRRLIQRHHIFPMRGQCILRIPAAWGTVEIVYMCKRLPSRRYVLHLAGGDVSK